MKKTFLQVALTGFIACGSFVPLAHAEEGNGEKAGRKVDEAAAKADAAAHKAGKKVKRAAKTGVNETGKAMEKAGQKTQDAVK